MPGIHEEICQGIEDGGGGRIGSNDEALHARFAEGALRDRADRGEGALHCQIVKLLRAEEFPKVVHGGGAEEQDGVGNILEDVFQIVRVVGSGAEGFVGDDFRDVRTEALQSLDQVVIGTIAARKKHTLAANFGLQFLREGDAVVFLGDVGDSEARGPRCFRGGGTDGGDLCGPDGIVQRNLKLLGALLERAHGILAGEENPVIFTQPAERVVQRRQIIRRRERDHRQQNRLSALFAQGGEQRLALLRGARDRDALA